MLLCDINFLVDLAFLDDAGAHSCIHAEKPMSNRKGESEKNRAIDFFSD